MELYPTPRSWRIALLTAFGAAAVMIAGVAGLVATGRVPGLWWAIVAAGLATLLPAIGLMSARVDIDEHGVTITRFGISRHFAWTQITGVTIIERSATVPDGTEYHWWLPSRRRHRVAVPTLQLADGTQRQLSAIASPAIAATTSGSAEEDGARHADECRAVLLRLRAAATEPAPATAPAIETATVPVSSSSR
ncbi:MAG TPA: hypothetical protein VN636_12245 [Acidimicrobiia bacterium]|nr:hypothetical protein [Acidimicrobiia bacterium]